MGNTGFKAFEAGEMSDWKGFDFDVPGLPQKAKCFLGNKLGLKGMEVSLNCLAPLEDMPFVHRHRNNEELYLFLQGTGEFQADDQIVPIQSGTCIQCDPKVARSWRNTGTEDLLFVVIQAPIQATSATTINDGEVMSDKPLWAQ